MSGEKVALVFIALLLLFFLWPTGLVYLAGAAVVVGFALAFWVACAPHNRKN